MARESLEAFDEIEDLAEAKSCLKIVYRKYETCHAVARIYLCTTLIALVVIVVMAFILLVLASP